MQGQAPAQREPHKRRGKGLAAMWKAPAMPPNPGSSATVRLNEDGTATVSIGGVDIGQGALTAMAQLAAEGLGIKIEDVRVNTVDTDYSPYEWQTVASRLTWSMGNAVLQAAENARTQILQTVAEAWGEDINDLDIIDGQVVSYRTEESQAAAGPRDLRHAAAGRHLDRRSGRGTGPVHAGLRHAAGPETGQGPRAVVHFTTGCQAVEVEVDKETGEVQVLKIVSAYDVGKAINPDMVRTQMEGGAVQGMSTALLEGIILDHGVPRNPNFTDYRIATASTRRWRSRTSSSRCRRTTARSARAASASTRWCRRRRPSPTPSTTPSACGSTACRSPARKCGRRCRSRGLA